MSAPRDPDHELDSAETGGHGGARVLLAFLVFLPVAGYLDWKGGRASWTFLAAVLAMIPLAGFLGRATEEIAIRTTSSLGGLLNATLGNAIELLIAARLLIGGGPHAAAVVRASIVGSIVTNLLLLIGCSMFAGGLRFREQKFNNTAASVSSSLLIIAFAGVSIPTIFGHFESRAQVPALSHAVSVTLALVYLAGIIFTFRTHRHLFDTTDELREAREPEWSMRRALLVLGGTILVVAWLAGILERTLEHAGHELHLSQAFVGVVVIGAITNVAENLSAVSYARKDLIDLSIQIGTSSAIQVLLFVVPVLVLIGFLTGHEFTLQFTLFELACMLLPVMITNHLASDGVCNWLEGLQLVALYALIGTAFFYVS